MRIERLLGRAISKRLGRRATYEWRPTKLRRWRVDIVYPSIGLCIEVDGNRHCSNKQRRSDYEKDNFLHEAGYVVLRYPASSVLTQKRFPRIVDQICRVACDILDDDAATCVLKGD